MDEEITYADLRQPAGCLSPAKQQHGSVHRTWGLLSFHPMLYGTCRASITSKTTRGGDVPVPIRPPKVSVLGVLLLLLLLLLLLFWKLLGDRCYRLSMGKGNWTQAKRECENLQSQLVVLQKKAEKDGGWKQSSGGPSSATTSGLRPFPPWSHLQSQAAFQARLLSESHLLGSNHTDLAALHPTSPLQKDFGAISQDNLKEIAGAVNQPVWIGLEVSKNQWKWVDNSSFNTAEFGNLASTENHCGTFKNTEVEDDACNGEHEWICQKEPLHLHP
uniref:Blec2 n=1 Tax=Lyrurus tetrix TaxID=1233216 RepID=I6PDC8_9GALL|nr:Blec2 [Lyrurus tetrix]